jgi:hypothetical protein
MRIADLMPAAVQAKVVSSLACTHGCRLLDPVWHVRL